MRIYTYHRFEPYDYILEERWCCNGTLHRDDGPAYQEKGGYRAWYCRGLRHRGRGPDGKLLPATEHSDGGHGYYVDGRPIFFALDS